MVRLTLFILVALALHALAYIELTPQLSAKEPRTVRTTVVPVRLTARQDAKPVTTPPQPAPVPTPTPAPKPKAKAAPIKEAPLPKLTRHADKAGPDQGSRKSVTEPKAKVTEAPKSVTEPKAEVAEAPKSVTEPKAKVAEAPKPLAKAAPNKAAPHTYKSKTDYFQRVARMADRAPRAGWAVPDLVTDDGLSFTEMRDILRFYGCKVVAYPLPRGGAPSFFLELDGNKLDQAVRREGKNMLDGYSSRARDLTDQPGFWKVLTRIAPAHQLDPYHACIAAVVPDRVDRYFLYMQDRAARSAGLPLDALRSTRGRFLRTNVGWTLEIYEVTPRQGAAVAVKLDRG